MKLNFNDNIESPFEPDRPVSPENFTGRINTIKLILRYAKSASNGNIKHFFLTGDKGLGKTSVADYVKDYIESNIGMTGVYVSNKENNTVEGLINLISKAMLSKIPNDSLTDKLKKIFDYIDSFEYGNAKINFNKASNVENDLHINFYKYLKEFINEINEQKGVLLIIDDINGLSESTEFPNWYKRLVETINIEKDDFKLYVLFAGYPEKFEKLVEIEPSFTRIFHYKEIGTLNNDEIKAFFKETFDKVNISYSGDIIELLTKYSAGLPLVMQNIGDYAFWAAENNVLTKEDTINSIIHAGNEIGNKQLINTLKQITSEEYLKILINLGKNELFRFKKTDFKEKLNSSEKEVFNDFLNYMVDLGILLTNDTEHYEIYEFSNQLYYAYFLIKSLE